MKYLFSVKGGESLVPFLTPSTLFAFDLDGTLAPIVAEPDGICIPDDVHSLLTRLNEVAAVAIITGRSCDDARSHLGFTPRWLVGNHGAEGLPDDAEHVDRFSDTARTWVEQLSSLIPDYETGGILLEEKGASIALHYRNASHPDATRTQILDALAKLVPPPRVVSGKCVENLVPRQARHKGDALQLIMRHSGITRALFVGDDVTDEDVFALLDSDILGIRVGRSASSTAALYLEKQDEMARFLTTVLDALKRGTDV